MTSKQYIKLLKEFGLMYNSYYADEYDLLEFGPDAYLDEGFTESICGWRRSPSHFAGNNWMANSLIVYECGMWNGQCATTVKAGRKLLNEYFRKLKQKEIDKKKREIEESGASYYA